MYKPIFNRREVLIFRQFQRKNYSLFACLGREVLISVLSVATLSATKAAGISDETWRADSSQVIKEVWLGDVGVTGSRAPLTKSQAARMVTVLSREDIAQAPVQSVNDLLKYAVGVDVRQRGPIGAQTDIGIRGGTQEQITILLNGINICDPQTGHNAFDFPVDISEIERIEVLEGPAGRVLGTSSLMGAVNIVTKVPDSRGATAHLEGGSFGYLSAGGSATMARPGVPWRSQVSGSYTRSDGYSRSANGHLNSDYHGGKALYQGRYDDESVRVDWHAGLSTKGYGSNTFYSAKYDEQYERTTKFFTALQGETKTGRIHVHPAVYWNRSYDRFELMRGTEDKVPYNYHRTDVFGLQVNNYFDWALGRTALGVEFRNEDIVSTNLGEPLHESVPIHGSDRRYVNGLNRSNLSFSLEHNLLLRKLTLSAGAVIVKNTWNGMPFQVYPGIDASYRVADLWKVYASYNSSLRMPSFTELYYSVGGHQADKYLKPEKLHAVEAGLKGDARSVSLKAAVFYHHCSNMIDWVMDTADEDKVWKSVNHTKVNTIGFEVQSAFDFKELFNLNGSKFSISYCYMNEDKEDSGSLTTQSKLEYLRHKLVASLHADVWRQLSADVKYRLQRRAGNYTTNAGEVKSYAAYGLVDARLSWNEPSWSVYAEVNNLLDNRDYVDYGNVPQPGAWITVGTQWHLGR